MLMKHNKAKDRINKMEICMNKKVKKIAFIISLVISSQSFAGLEIYSTSMEQARNNGNYSFTQNGVSGEKADVVKGFGKDMPLGLSLQVIVPKTWQVNLNAGAEDMLVNWEGKSTWPYVLENLAKQNNLQINIDWTSKIVDVYSKDAAQRKQVAQMEDNITMQRDEIVNKHSKYANHMDKDVVNKYKKNDDGDVSIEDIYDRANVKPLDGKIRSFVSNVYNNNVGADTNARFILKKQVMLSDNIKMWGEYTGWDIKWNSDVDYMITNDVVFEGNLRQGIEKALKLYSESEKPLKANFYDGNKVVDIKEFVFNDPKIKVN